MIQSLLLCALLLFLTDLAFAWVPRAFACRKQSVLDAAVGIYFGTSTGSTQECAEAIYEAFGSDIAAEPVDIDTVDAGKLAEEFGQHGSLILGTPTWNTGMDTERSGTGWDDLYYGVLPDLKQVLSNKKVAVFGLGDQVSYAENYADATGELYDVFQSIGCDMVEYAMVSQEGYEHEASKSVRGDFFCGLLLDQVNQDDLTEERVANWVDQLKAGGFLNGGGNSAVAPAAEASSVVDAVVINEEAANGATHEEIVNGPTVVSQTETLDNYSQELDETIGSHSSGGFTPHFNPVSGKTMWTSPDGRKSYVTESSTTTITANLRP